MNYTFDNHSVALLPLIRRCLKENKSKIPVHHPQCSTIKHGASLLWRNYFRYADKDDDTTEILEPLSSVVQRLCNDLKENSEDVRCIKEYGAMFGLPLLRLAEKIEKKMSQ